MIWFVFHEAFSSQNSVLSGTHQSSEPCFKRNYIIIFEMVTFWSFKNFFTVVFITLNTQKKQISCCVTRYMYCSYLLYYVLCWFEINIKIFFTYPFFLFSKQNHKHIEEICTFEIHINNPFSYNICIKIFNIEYFDNYQIADLKLTFWYLWHFYIKCASPC